MTIGSGFTEPGTYSQYKQTVKPVVPGGARVLVLVGDGRQTNLVTQEAVIRGGGANGSDSLAHAATVLAAKIVDEDFNTYLLGTDYLLTSNAVAWSPSAVASLTGTTTATFSGLPTKTFKFTLASGAEQTITFVTGDFVSPSAATAAEVATAIQARGTGVTASASSNHVLVATVATNNSSLYIGAGTANDILGFTEGSLVSTPKEPAAGKSYTVDYEYAKVSSDYKYRFFDNGMSDITAEHGDVSTSNTISLAAEIAIQHGANFIGTVQIDPADGSTLQQYQRAIDKLAAVEGINIIVPLNTNPVLHSYLKNHVDTASSIEERKERTAIVGLANGVTTTNAITYAEGLADKRMVTVYLSGVPTRYVGTNTTPSNLDASYVAAGLAGIRCSIQYDIAEPLTGKEVIGFYDIPDTLRRTTKNLLAQNGVLVVGKKNGIPKVWYQTTTNPATYDTKEYSVVEIIDFVASSLRSVLDIIYIGHKILPDTPSQIATTVSALLTNLKERSIINDATDIQATPDGTDPTQINVQFKIKPVEPCNYILITFSI